MPRQGGGLDGAAFATDRDLRFSCSRCSDRALGKGKLRRPRPATCAGTFQTWWLLSEWDIVLDGCVISVFRRTAEHPLYRIEKRPKLRARQQLYAVVAMDGTTLRRGPELAPVLKVLERKLIRPID